ncbi:MAG: glutathione S-transferase family protein [Myxococcales bacterium FL481]|nr:MAG: glutathione S-transferase family protein [Myxococcales bacterium FL481]
MTYTLYGAKGSGSSIIEAALLEIGAAYAFKPVDMRHDAQREGEYTSINPHQKIPTLVTPESETLTESAAIVLTLAERHPQAGLLPPAASPERARALRWLLFAAAELYPVIEIVDYPERFSPDEAARAGVRERANEIWRRRWLTVEANAIDEGPCVLGHTFCATDIYLAVLSRWNLANDWRSEHLPRVDRLANEVAARPKLRQLWARSFPGK